jgi:hypothetical protein
MHFGQGRRRSGHTLLRDQPECHRAKCRHRERANPPLAQLGMSRRP